MVEVVGSKYIEGVGKKSGKPYKAYLIWYTKIDKTVNGLVTGDEFIDVSLLNGQVPMPGDQVDLLYNKQGFLDEVKFY